MGERAASRTDRTLFRPSTLGDGYDVSACVQDPESARYLPAPLRYTERDNLSPAVHNGAYLTRGGVQ